MGSPTSTSDSGPRTQAKDSAKREKPQKCKARFCAGAATADITPPVTSPQWGYTFRHCAATDPAEVVAHIGGVEGAPPILPGHFEEGLAWVLGGGPPCASNKLSPDTNLYAKTFPPSEGTFGRLQANAFVLQDANSTKLAIVNVDLGGLPGEVHEAVAKRIEDQTGIGRENLLISATHTHGGPGGIFQYQGYALLGGDEFDPRIYEAVVSGITRAIIEADGRLHPAKLATGEMTLTDANHNRRTSAWALNPEASSGISPHATRLLVIRIDTEDGIPLGAITNFANHGVIHSTFNLYMSGDNQGTTTRAVARAIRQDAEAQGINFPRDWEVVDALTNGAAGDQSPNCDSAGWDYTMYGRFGGDVVFKQFACMENAAMRQAPAALAVWRDLGASLSSEVTLDARFDWVCFCGQQVPDDPFDPYDTGAAVPANDDPKYFEVSPISILGQDGGFIPEEIAGPLGQDGRSFPRTVFPAHHKKWPRLIGSQTNPSIVRIQLMRIGRLAFASMPGEPTIQMARRIEGSVMGALNEGGANLVDRVVVVGLANDYDSYMATIQEYEAYLYEGGFSLFGQQTGNLLKWRLVQLAEWMRDGSGVPECTRDRGCAVHPDTTFTTAQPEPLVSDFLVGTVEDEPEDVERFVGTSLSWLGGGPGAEWTPDDPIVELQEKRGKKWVTVATDLDTEIPLHYDKRRGTHHWTAFFDPTKDWPEGTYRFLVTGHKGTGPNQRDGYELASRSFNIARSASLAIVKQAGFAVQHPAPDPRANYRYRERIAATATVTGILTRDGTTQKVTMPAVFTLVQGETLVVAPGGIIDAFGNTNSEPFTLSG